MSQHLKSYHEEFYRANELSEPRRTRVLSEIMTDMERAFRIPMLNSEQYNQTNSDVLALYKEISLARTL